MKWNEISAYAARYIIVSVKVCEKKHTLVDRVYKHHRLGISHNLLIGHDCR